jgi:regulator of RNase E activity RraB
MTKRERVEQAIENLKAAITELKEDGAPPEALLPYEQNLQRAEMQLERLKLLERLP